MKNLILLVILLPTIVLTGCQSTQEKMTEKHSTNEVDVSDKVVQMKRGVVLMKEEGIKMSSSEMEDANKKTGNGLIVIGGLTAATGNGEAGAAIAAVGLLAKIAKNAGDDEIEVTRYTVQIPESGKTGEVLQIDKGNIGVNSPVFVKLYDSGKLQVALDETQGVQYNNVDETQFNDTAVQIVEKAEQAEADAAQAKLDAEAATNQAEDEEWSEDQYKRRVEAETKAIEEAAGKTGEIIDANNEAAKNAETTNINVN
ncbi:hypothetical protein L4C54_05840 [Vibrio lamellibrachiae]|uniref:hypothetical protein n=1 Tax=Vibrio lamellibrachiae TaxID=2910253 RepID=UPI003D0B505D